jgi:hypothetical protein
MKNESDNSLRQWLRAEGADDTERAEGALRGVFRRLADPAPSLGFADAVMARVLPIRHQEQIAVGWRVLLATSLVLVALTVAVLPLFLWPIAELVRFSSVVSLAASLVVAASQALAGWLAFWQSLGEATRVLLEIVSKPSVAAMMIAVAGLGVLVVRVLAGLKALDRSVDNV